MNFDPLKSPARFALLLGAILLFCFGSVLFSGQTFCYRDFGMLAIPVASYHKYSFWQGELPLWNPYSNCGAPFLAQWGTMTLYPGSLLYLLLPLPWSLNLFSILHLFGAGMGIFLLALKWTENSFSGAISALAYVFSGITLACLVWPNYVVALCWVPWLVLLMDRAWDTPGRFPLAACIVAALQLLAGVPELCGLTWLVILGLGLFRWKFASLSPAALFRQAAIVVLVAAGLTAAQLLPFFDLLAHSHRIANFSGDKWALPAWGWANFILPMFHAFRTFQGPFWQAGQEFLGSTYLGIVILFLGGAGFFSRERKLQIFFAILILIFSILALGAHGFLYPIFKQFIPFAGLARYPIKFLLLVPFLLALLAAFGANSPALRDQRSASFMAGAGLVILALLLVVARSNPLPYDWWTGTWKNALARAAFLSIALMVCVIPLKSCVFQYSLLLLIVLDGLTHLPKLNPTASAQGFQGALWEAATKFEAPKPGESRVMISPMAEQALLYSRTADLGQDLIAKRVALWSHLNLLDRIPKINGSSTLQIREQRQVQDLLYAKTNTSLPGLVNFLGAKYVSKSNQPLDWELNTNAAPLISAGQKVIKPLASTNALALLADTNFSGRDLVIVDGPETLRTSAAVALREWKPHKVSFKVTARTNTVALIAQSYYHHWKARVNGTPVPLLRANHAFQAVQLGPGDSEVELRYQDRRFMQGACISGTTILMCIVVRCRRNRKER